MTTVRAALQVVLDCVDHTRGACGLTEMVGAVLPRSVIEKARDALASTDEGSVTAAAIDEQRNQLAQCRDVLGQIASLTRDIP